MRDEQAIIYEIDNFKTINRKVKLNRLPKDVGYYCQNLRYDEEYGSLRKRKNRAKYNGTALGTSPIKSQIRYYKNTTNAVKYVISYGTTLKVGTDSAGTFANIATSLTTDLRFKFLVFKDLLYGVNGTDNNQVYDGANNCVAMGVPTPTAPTLALGAATGLTGAYYYKVTYELDSYQEGNASVASAVINPSNEKVTVTIPTSTNTRVTARTIYRTAAGGAVYYKLTRVADNTTVTYTDSTADGSLDTTITAPTDYGAPSARKYICLHKQRLFIAKDSTLDFSDIRSGTAYPDVFPVANTLYILRDNGEDITFIGNDNFGQLIIMKPSSIIKINTGTDDPVGWSGIDEILSVNGCIAPYSAVLTPVGVIYVARYGENRKRLMIWNGSQAVIIPELEGVEPVLSAITEGKLASIVGHYHNGYYYLSYHDPSGGEDYLNRLFTINLFDWSVNIDKKNIDSFSSWNNDADFGELYSGTSDATGFTYREDTEVFNIIHDTKSELDTGTYSQQESGGTEASPTVIFTAGSLSDDVGAQTVSTLTTDPANLVSGYTADNDTVSPSGSLVSAVLEINAKHLDKIYWTETLGSYGDVQFWVRTGDTTAACAAASWSGPYTDPTGSDISAVTAAKYIQYKCKLYVSDIAQLATVYLSLASGYVVKITANLGTPAETTIEIDWISGRRDFSDLNPAFKRLRKRLYSVKIEFERATASGTLTYYYYLDGSTTPTQVDIALATYGTQGYYIYQFPLATYCFDIQDRFYSNSDASEITIKKLIYNLQVEPYYQLL